MDFSDVSAAAENGAVLELKDPTGELILKPDGSPVTITLMGTESKQYKKARNAIGDRYLKKATPRKAAMAETTEEAISDLASQLAAVTISWDGIIRSGITVECTRDNARALYIDCEWVREQADNFVGERRNFWKASPKS